MHDLAVIGGGPAGTSAAITAARSGARVLLLERGKYPRQKVCGEFVSAESLTALANLLTGQDSALLSDARISNTRVFLDGRVLQAALNPPAASIARIDLDAALWHAAEDAGVEAHQQCAVQSANGGGPFTLTASMKDFQARAVIDASGRWSNLMPAQHRNHTTHSRWLGIKGHFAETSAPNSVDLYFFEGGYCGVQPVTLHSNGAGGRVNACAMVRSDVATTLPEVFALHPDLQRRSLDWQPCSEAVITSPLFFREPQPTRGNVLLAGDAATFVDPFIGDGISLALRSGIVAAQSLLPFFAGTVDLAQAASHYRQDYEQRLAPVYRMSSRVRRMLDAPRTLRAPILAVLEHTPTVIRYLIRKTR